MWHQERDISPECHRQRFIRAGYRPRPPPAPVIVRHPGMKFNWSPPPSRRFNPPQWVNCVVPLNEMDIKLCKKRPVGNGDIRPKLEKNKSKKHTESVSNSEHHKPDQCYGYRDENCNFNEIALLKQNSFGSESVEVVRDINQNILSDDDCTEKRHSENTSYKEEELAEEEGDTADVSTTGANISRWARGARALRDTHVRLVRRQLRQIQRINHALDRLIE